MGCSTCGTQFETVGRWPVLVDFDRSVLAADRVRATGGQSLVGRRRGRLLRLAKTLLKPRNKVVEYNLTTLINILPSNARVLVVGGGERGAGTGVLYAAPGLRLTAFDIYASEDVQLIADAHAIPFADATFDAVLVQAVLEHVLEPQRVVEEIHRVLRPDGLVYAETPFLQNVHEGAWDFTRFTESGHRWLFRAFEKIDSGPIGGPAAQLVWSLSYLAWALTRRRAAARVVRALTGALEFLDRLIPVAYRIDSATGTYFLGRRSQSAITAKDAVAGYLGAQTE